MDTVVFFDVDGTLVAGNINKTIIWHLWRMRLASSKFLLRAAVWYFLWKLGLFTDVHDVARMGARGLAGISQKNLDDALGNIFSIYVRKKIYREGRDLVEEHKNRGDKIILLSSSFEPFVKKVAANLGLSEVIATRLAIENNLYTGKIDGMVVGGRKHIIVETFIKEHHPKETYAYTDHYQDAPLLEMVTHPVAVNPDRKLSLLAARRHWPIMRFSLIA